jgi:hypothetical protein
MTSGVAFNDYPRPLPNAPLAMGGDDLPPPPGYHHQYQQPPPQIVTDFATSSSLPQIDALPSFGSLEAGTSNCILSISLPYTPHLDPGLIVPLTPTTPTSPSGSTPTFDSKQKKSNPLIDLIDTERVYVEQLTGVIRVSPLSVVLPNNVFTLAETIQKVAAAWSRSNLPPPELDTMFRSIEVVYKANRALLAVS